MALFNNCSFFKKPSNCVCQNLTMLFIFFNQNNESRKGTSERPIHQKVVSADTEYSAAVNRIFGRIFGRYLSRK